MKHTTKTGRKVLGALVAAAVMVSMLPAMILADAPAGSVSVNATPTETVSGAGAAKTFNGITVSALTSGNDIEISSNNKYFEVKYQSNQATSFSFAINERGAYAGYSIVGIEIGGATATNVSLDNGSTAGWSDFTWSGEATSVTLAMHGDGNNSFGRQHRLTFTYITVYVAKKVTSVTMDDMDLFAGDDAAEMTVTLDPADTTYSVADLTWTSSEEGVATVAVSDGKVMVTPVGLGSTTISATLGNTALGQATVTVYSNDQLIVTASPSSLSLAPDGDTATLSYTVSGAVDHEWEFDEYFSNDESVVTVDEDGLVTSVGVGETTIEVWIYDITNDTFVYGECTVTVSDEPAPDPEPDVPFYTEEQLRAMSVQNFVEGMYFTVLNRQFDAQGRDSWMSLLLEQGGTATTVAIGFLESPEFTSMNLDNEQFIATCYRVFCNRAASEAETAQWVAQLEGGATRDSVIRQFAQSPEWANICAFFKVNV